ncbi:unnamed protein product, partial [Staurois parvus]
MQGPRRPDIVNAVSKETRYSECRVRGRPDIVNARSWGPILYEKKKILEFGFNMKKSNN